MIVVGTALREKKKNLYADWGKKWVGGLTSGKTTARSNCYGVCFLCARAKLVIATTRHADMLVAAVGYTAFSEVPVPADLAIGNGGKLAAAAVRLAWLLVV